MKLENLLRHIADNEEAGLDWCAGLNFKLGGGPNWEDVIDNPEWFSLKPKTRMVNGFEVPAPMSKKPANGQTYFSTYFENESYVGDYSWANDDVDNLLFKRNICFSEPEAAAANAKAMLGIDPYPSKKEL